jgi:hypothetical protein
MWVDKENMILCWTDSAMILVRLEKWFVYDKRTTNTRAKDGDQQMIVNRSRVAKRSAIFNQ